MRKHFEQRKNAKHYEQSCDFLGMFDADSFDEEVETDAVWMGLVREEDGMLHVYAEYVYDGEGLDSGTGWWL